MEYFRPMDYLIVINGSKLKIVSDGKKNIMNLSANKMMGQMQDMLTACMIGDLSKMSSNYQLAYFEDAQFYLVKIKPVNKAVQAYITGIEIYLDKKICRYTNSACPKQPRIIPNTNSITKSSTP